ncbi:molecular chaperone GrpE [Corynebacterium segmentosum]
MMGQELFEHPKKQHKTYGLTALGELGQRIGDPEAFAEDRADADQIAAMEEALEAALTFDEDADAWIVGAEEDIEKMFTDREAFLEALLNDEDPGI